MPSSDGRSCGPGVSRSRPGARSHKGIGNANPADPQQRPPPAGSSPWTVPFRLRDGERWTLKRPDLLDMSAKFCALCVGRWRALHEIMAVYVNNVRGGRAGVVLQAIWQWLSRSV
jgi:hypothetical protein